MKITFTIYGQPYSKANSRRLVMIPDGKGGKRASFVKAKEALAYERDALKQIPPVHRVRLEGPVRLTARLFYATERPDLDASLIRDILQDRFAKDKKSGERVLVQNGVYRNDRQVREEHYYWGKDAANPRAELEIEAMEIPIARTAPLFAEASVPEGVPF